MTLNDSERPSGRVGQCTAAPRFRTIEAPRTRRPVTGSFKVRQSVCEGGPSCRTMIGRAAPVARGKNSDMRRRQFITLLGAAAAWPLVARAQQDERIRRIGILLPATADDGEYQSWMRTFLQGLGQSGWTVGRNLQVDTHWAGADVDVIRRKAVELVASAPDVILAHGNGPVSTLLQTTRTVPIVFPIAGDPVGTGLVNRVPGRDQCKLKGSRDRAAD